MFDNLPPQPRFRHGLVSTILSLHWRCWLSHLKRRYALSAGSSNCHFLTDSRIEPGCDRILACRRETEP